jgi:hypothetical protein
VQKPEPTCLNVRDLLRQAAETSYAAGCAQGRKEPDPSWRGSVVLAAELVDKLAFEDHSCSNQDERQRVATRYSEAIKEAVDRRRIPTNLVRLVIETIIDVALVVAQTTRLGIGVNEDDDWACECAGDDPSSYRNRHHSVSVKRCDKCSCERPDFHVLAVSRLHAENDVLKAKLYEKEQATPRTTFSEIVDERNRLLARVVELEGYAKTMDARESELQNQVKALNAARAGDQHRLFHYEALLKPGVAESVEEDFVSKAGDALQQLCEEASTRARVYKNDESVLVALNAGIATIRTLLLAYGSKGTRTPEEAQKLIDRIGQIADLGPAFNRAIGHEVRAFLGLTTSGAHCPECGVHASKDHMQSCRFWIPSAQQFATLPGHWRSYINGLKDRADDLEGRLSATKGSPSPAEPSAPDHDRPIQWVSGESEASSQADCSSTSGDLDGGSH